MSSDLAAEHSSPSGDPWPRGQTTATGPCHPPQKAQGYWSKAFKRLRRNRVAVASGVLLIAIFASCFASWPWAAGAYSRTNYSIAYQGPTAEYPLGTDEHGRNYLAQILYGGRISLTVGFLAASVAVCIGTLWGLIAGYAGGRTDAFMMRIVDVLYSLPYILLVVLLTLVFGRDWRVLFLAIGAVSWLTMARVIRGQVLQLKAMPFIEAARALGLPAWRILLVHMLPNLAGPILVYATLTVPQAILQESFLSFLGIGMPPDYPTWGALAQQVTQINSIANDWHLILPPCVALSVTLLALNFLGDGLRDALDPQSA
jgi:oligopeptide transport system permease protein